MNASRTSHDPRAIGEMILARKWFFFVPFLVTLLAAACVIERLPPIYRVRSMLLYQDRWADAELLKARLLSQDLMIRIAEVMGYLDDPKVFARAQEQKSLAGDPKSAKEIAREDMAYRLRSKIVFHHAGAGLYGITVEDRNPKTVYELATRINENLASEAVGQDERTHSLLIIEAPRWPHSPVSPNKARLYPLSVLAGLVLGLAVLALREYFDTSLRDVDAAEELVGAPILGTIPRIEFLHLPGSHGGPRKSLLFTLLGVILVGAAIGCLVYYANQGRETTEEGNATTLNGPTGWVLMGG